MASTAPSSTSSTAAEAADSPNADIIEEQRKMARQSLLDNLMMAKHSATMALASKLSGR